jgi:hypothetical protein
LGKDYSGGFKNGEMESLTVREVGVDTLTLCHVQQLMRGLDWHWHGAFLFYGSAEDFLVAVIYTPTQFPLLLD